MYYYIYIKAFDTIKPEHIYLYISNMELNYSGIYNIKTDILYIKIMDFYKIMSFINILISNELLN